MKLIVLLILLMALPSYGKEYTESRLYAEYPHWEYTHLDGQPSNKWHTAKWVQKYELSTDTDPYILLDYWVREPTGIRNFSLYWTDDLRDGEWIDIGTITPTSQRGRATLIIDREHPFRSLMRDGNTGFVRFHSGYIYEYSLHNF